MESKVDGLCGCGRPVRYYTFEPEEKGSCNKYGRCPTYDELYESFTRVNSLLHAYQAKRAVDGLNGRTWDAAGHFEAEALIEKLTEA